MKKRISIIICLFWLGFIFYMSSKPGVESHNMSLKIVNAITNRQSTQEKFDNNKPQQRMPQVNNNSPKLKQPSNNTSKEKNEATTKKNYDTAVKQAKPIANKQLITSKAKVTKSNSFNLDNFVRKNAHAFEYIVLSILVSSSFFAFNKRGKAYIIYILFICLFYAVTDEFHQSFVSGRTSLASDILIDFSGAIIGTTIFYLLYYKVIKKTRSVKQSY